jgi:flavin reductase (DIM6/NTAB) family NADH-FMN oxidoreductase RutF
MSNTTEQLPVAGRPGSAWCGLAATSATARDKAHFRSLMSTFATGITVVTTIGDTGPAGMTVNALASLSLDPMLVMIGFNLKSRTLTAVRQSQRFAVNVLASDQERIGRIFASKLAEVDKFAACRYADFSGVPVLDGTLAWLLCDVVAVYPGGDHVILVGAVQEMGGDGGEPLLFYGGHYRTLGPAGSTPDALPGWTG